LSIALSFFFQCRFSEQYAFLSHFTHRAFPPTHKHSHSNIVPAPGAPASTPSKLAVEVPVQTWSIYAHPQAQYQGLWLHSKLGEYRLTAPSAEYAPYAQDFARCVRYAVAIHLFVTDVIGVDDAEDDQMMDLEMLMGMMTEQNLDMAFIRQNGSALYDLLRDLMMNKKFKFMLELSKMRTPAVVASTSSSSSSSAGGAAAIHASSSSSSSNSSSSNRATHGSSASGKPSPSEARAARVALAARAAAVASPGEGSIDANAAAGSAGMDEGPASEVEEEEEAEAPKKKQRRRRRKAEAGGSGAGGLSSAHAASSSSHGAASSSSSSGHHHQHHTEPPPPQNSNTEEDALLTLPGCSFLNLSSEVPKLMNTLSGHNRRLLVAIEQQRTAEVIAKQLGEFERILNGLADVDFEPMHYLLSGIHGGEAFFIPLFDLYRLLKRVRLTCPEQYKPRVAALRFRLVEEFTAPVLRDVWLIQNRGSVRTEVRALKDAEKMKWVQAKLKRLNLVLVELRKVREAEKEVARKEQVQRRKERAVRREEWEKGHESRKEARREGKAAGKEAAREAKRAAGAAAAAAGLGEGEMRMEIEVGGDVEENEDVSRGEKRGATEGGMEGGPAAKRGGIISPDSARTDDSLLSSFQKGPEESKCTLSPMVYGGGRASSANGGGASAKPGLMAGGSSSSSSRSSSGSSSSTTRGAQAVL